MNRNGIYIFVNRRLVRDRLILHAIHEAYRNILPPTVFPATLLFLEMPYEEVDVNVHPAKIEVRFRRSEEHTSELQSPCNLVCRLLLEKKQHRPPREAAANDGRDERLSTRSAC